MSQRNVLGSDLEPCSYDPLTGYYRSGCCENRGDDPGMHVVCVVMTDEFLAFSKLVGNDLSTPMPQYGFAGLKDGDQWCLCAARWQEAFEAGERTEGASGGDALVGAGVQLAGRPARPRRGRLIRQVRPAVTTRLSQLTVAVRASLSPTWMRASGEVPVLAAHVPSVVPFSRSCS